jgi:Na+/H+-translocating membrane pyrophosphatase
MKSGIIGFVLGALVVGVVAYYPTQTRQAAQHVVDASASAASSALSPKK